MRVSVVIPCFNEGHFVEASLESIQKQSCLHEICEVLVVDDGSTDDSLNILRALERRHRILNVIAQRNQGAAVARNAGIDVAKGEFIALLDADDIWLPQRLEKQIPVLACHPEVGLVYSDFQSVSPDTLEVIETVRCRSYFPDTPNALETYFVEDAPFMTSTVLLRKSVVQRVGGFDSALRIAQDNELWIRILAESAAFHVPEPLVLKRRRRGSLGADVERKYVFQREITEKSVRNFPRLAPLARKRTARRLAKVGQYLRGEGNILGALQYYFRALVSDWKCSKVYFLLFSVLLPTGVVNHLKYFKGGGSGKRA